MKRQFEVTQEQAYHRGKVRVEGHFTSVAKEISFTLMNQCDAAVDIKAMFLGKRRARDFVCLTDGNNCLWNALASEGIREILDPDYLAPEMQASMVYGPLRLASQEQLQLLLIKPEQVNATWREFERDTYYRSIPSFFGDYDLIIVYTQLTRSAEQEDVLKIIPLDGTRSNEYIPKEHYKALVQKFHAPIVAVRDWRYEVYIDEAVPEQSENP
jgi:hypothetical protein